MKTSEQAYDMVETSTVKMKQSQKQGREQHQQPRVLAHVTQPGICKFVLSGKECPFQPNCKFKHPEESPQKNPSVEDKEASRGAEKLQCEVCKKLEFDDQHATTNCPFVESLVQAKKKH